MSGSIFLSSSGSNYPATNYPASMSSPLQSKSKSTSTSALFEVVSDSVENKSLPKLSTSQIRLHSSPESLFNRLPQARTEAAHKIECGSIFNVVGEKKFPQSQIIYSKTSSKMPGKNQSDIFHTKKIAPELEAKPWNTKPRKKDEVSDLSFN